MSLELLKEMFNEKPIGIQYEEEIEDKEQIIERLENETHDLSKQISILKKEKNMIDIGKIKKEDEIIKILTPADCFVAL